MINYSCKCEWKILNPFSRNNLFNFIFLIIGDPFVWHKMNHWERMFRVKLINFFVYSEGNVKERFIAEQKKQTQQQLLGIFVSFDTELNKGEKYGIHYECSMKIFFQKKTVCVSHAFCDLCLQARKFQFLRFRVRSEARDEGGWRGVEGAAKSTCIIITLVHNQAIIVAPALSILVSPFSLPSRLKCVSFYYVHNNRKEFNFVAKSPFFHRYVASRDLILFRS